MSTHKENRAFEHRFETIRYQLSLMNEMLLSSNSDDHTAAVLDQISRLAYAYRKLHKSTDMIKRAA